MGAIRYVTDPDECRSLWHRLYPNECLFDEWSVRECFGRHYGREPLFIVHETGGKPDGLLPVCWAEDENKYLIFPGETWSGKTWVEQNRIVAPSQDVRAALLDAVPGKAHLRYLRPETVSNGLRGYDAEYDETGYLFYPAQVGFSYDQYLSGFSGKTRKKILAEVNGLYHRGASIRINEPGDVEHVFQMNIDAFGEDSYFFDTRFYNAVKSLCRWLDGHGMLRIVTVCFGDDIAAVDVAALRNNAATVFAGATSRAYPGVAKLINLYHMEWACRESIASVDFLCGDFGWKERFRLTAEPLYQLTIRRETAGRVEPENERRAVCGNEESACGRNHIGLYRHDSQNPARTGGVSYR